MSCPFRPTDVSRFTPLTQSPWVTMFAAKAIQADGIPIARTFEVGVPGYLLGRTPNGMGMRNILGGVLLMIAKSLEMFERNGTKNGSDMA